MYKDFFNFRELPFKLVPNPAFMFLSRSHEEALAHLSYAVAQGDGFVEITGEVGTGKTTLCRSFLESLDQKFEAAYIFNPKLDSMQLLKAVNDEFGIDSIPNSIKGLIDNLNKFLIIQKAAGKKVLLLIDEAQNLSKSVLEQLRLLSNLETTQDKLLQIILVGQPELDETLDSHDLRQLGQRITLSCRLLPLTFRETTDYIKHRINIAACKVKTRFSVLALRAVYTYSGGIPRLINIACDRALLTAFTLDQKSVSWKAARCAIRELTRRERLKKKPFPQKAWAGLSFLLLVSAATLFFLYPPDRPGTRVWVPSSNKIVDTSIPVKIQPPLLPATPRPAPETLPSEIIDPPPSKAPAVSDVGPSGPKKTESTTTKPATNELPTNTAPPSPPDRQDLRDKFQDMNIFKSRGNALRTVLDLWQTNTKIPPYPQRLADNYDFFRIAAEQNGFSLLRLKADLSLVKAFNLPAILELKPLAEAALRYSALVKIEASGVCLQNGPGRETIRLKEKELEQYWTGRVYIPWKNFSNFTGVAPITSPPETILALKNHLKAMGFDKIADTPEYDAVTRRAIQTIQKKNGLKPDGFVGPMTKIILYNQSESWEIPHLKGN
jgi:general secretion pathway protein A